MSKRPVASSAVLIFGLTLVRAKYPEFRFFEHKLNTAQHHFDSVPLHAFLVDDNVDDTPRRHLLVKEIFI